MPPRRNERVLPVVATIPAALLSAAPAAPVLNFKKWVVSMLVVLALVTGLLFHFKSELAVPGLGVTLLTANIPAYLNLFVIPFGSTTCLTFVSDLAIGLLPKSSQSLACL